MTALASETGRMPRPSKAEEAVAVIASMIDEGEPGDRLPRESELAKLAGVSRVTLREALDRLWYEGRIVRQWGLGTFIADTTPAPDAPPARNIYVSVRGVMPLAEDIRNQGHDAGLAGFAVERWTAPGWVGAEVAGSDQVWRVTRCLAIDGVPGILIRDYLALEYDGVPVDPVELSDLGTDLARFLSARGVRLVKHESVMEAVLCDDESARLLDLPVGAPVLRARQRAIADSGEVAACADIYYRSDVFSTVLVRTVRD